jgi:beta-glucosidase
VNPAQYPGTIRSNTWQEADYLEKLEVGYRWYDAEVSRATQTTRTAPVPLPLFSFGFGLSFTAYTYSTLRASATACSFTVTNAGDVAGVEIAQLYVGFPAAAGLPPKQLKGFERVQLAPKETKSVTVTLSTEDLSIWSVTEHAWVAVSGDFQVFVGASAADIRLKGAFSTAAAAEYAITGSAYTTRI